MHEKEIALLIHKLKIGQATDQDKEMLEEYWQNALNNTSILEEMPTTCREKLKMEMFHSIIDSLTLDTCKNWLDENYTGQD